MTEKTLKKGTFGLESDLSIDTYINTTELIDKLYKKTPQEKFFIKEPNSLRFDINLNVNVNKGSIREELDGNKE